MILCLSFFVLFLLVAAGYQMTHSFSFLYHYAEELYKNENYEAAMKYVDLALDKNPDNSGANLLMAEIMEQEGDIKSAILILKPFVKKDTAEVDVCKKLVELLAREGESEEIRKILKGSSQEIQEACSEYVCEAPVTSLAPGVYTSVRTVQLKADYEEIYYTLDGSIPDENSTRYTEPIVLNEGSTELKAFGKNSRGVTSEIISRKYVVVLNVPNAPEVTPESGDYYKKTKIKIEIPEGCRAYYAFDVLPDVDSTEYRQPVSMPEGEHTLYAILVAANGKVSKVTSREYYLEY